MCDVLVSREWRPHSACSLYLQVCCRERTFIVVNSFNVLMDTDKVPYATVFSCSSSAPTCLYHNFSFIVFVWLFPRYVFCLSLVCLHTCLFVRYLPYSLCHQTHKAESNQRPPSLSSTILSRSCALIVWVWASLFITYWYVSFVRTHFPFPDGLQWFSWLFSMFQNKTEARVLHCCLLSVEQIMTFCWSTLSFFWLLHIYDHSVIRVFVCWTWRTQDPIWLGSFFVHDRHTPIKVELARWGQHSKRGRHEVLDDQWPRGTRPGDGRLGTPSWCTSLAQTRLQETPQPQGVG